MKVLNAFCHQVRDTWHTMKHPHVREMDFTGKPMKGYVYVDTTGIESDTDLSQWVGLCMQFNESLAPK